MTSYCTRWTGNNAQLETKLVEEEHKELSTVGFVFWRDALLLARIVQTQNCVIITRSQNFIDKKNSSLPQRKWKYWIFIFPTSKVSLTGNMEQLLEGRCSIWDFNLCFMHTLFHFCKDLTWHGMKWVCKTQVLSIWGHRVFNLLNLADSYEHVFCVRHYFKSIPPMNCSVLIITLWVSSCYYLPIRAEETEAQRTYVLWPRFLNGEASESGCRLQSPCCLSPPPRPHVHMTTGETSGHSSCQYFFFPLPIQHFKNHL